MRSATPPRPHRGGGEENAFSESEDDAPPPALTPAERQSRRVRQRAAHMKGPEAVATTALVAPPPLPTFGRAGAKSSPRRAQEVTPLRASSVDHAAAAQFPQQQSRLDPNETLLLEKEVFQLVTYGLLQLAQLRREGLLSDAEFTQAKQHALQQAGAGASAGGPGQHQHLSTQTPSSPQPRIRMLGDDTRPEIRYSTPLRSFEELLPSPHGNSFIGGIASTVPMTQQGTTTQQYQQKPGVEAPSATKLGALFADRLGVATAPPDDEGAAPEQCQADVLAWLRSLRLEKHAAQIVAAGFDDMELLSGFSELSEARSDFFEAVPMTPGNKARFIQACRRLPAHRRRTASGRSRSEYANDSRGEDVQTKPEPEAKVHVAMETELQPAAETEPQPQPQPEPEPEPQPVTKSEPMRTGTQMERVLAAKKSIHKSQVLVLVATMLLCAAFIVAPTYIMGAMVGELESADGIAWVSFYFIWVFLGPAYVWLRTTADGTFAPALEGTRHRLSPGWRNVLVLGAFVAGICVAEIRNLFWFGDDLDLRFPFGQMHWDVPIIADVMVQMFHLLFVLNMIGGVEAIIMYRMRDEKLPPGKNRKWWQTSKQFGHGTLAAVAIVCVYHEALIVQWVVLMEFRVVEDRESAIAEYCNNRGCIQNLWLQQGFVPAIIVAMIVSTRNGPEPWPRLTRDLPAAWLLTVFNTCFGLFGTNTVQMAYENYSGGIGVLAVQISFEVYVLIVFLWARWLAARAYPRDPSGEAKALIWIIFASDTFAEMAFVNVEFGSSVFWVMVFMDFAMIVMRDADLWDELGTYLKKCCGKQRGKWISFAIAMGAGETDLAANQLDDEERGVKGSKTRRQKFIKVRMVASQAVASEFIVTGCFLIVSTLCYCLNEAGFVAYRQLIPLQTGVSSDCKYSNGTVVQNLACICDGNGAVGGIYTGKAGGCAVPEDMNAMVGTLMSTTDTSELTQPMCLVPLECTDIRVENATAAMQALDASWTQPSDHSYRVCDEGGDPVSDGCDPGPDQVQSNMLSFIMVFTAQIMAVLVSKVILARKMRIMVEENEQARRGLLVMLDAKELKRVDTFMAREKEQEEEQPEEIAPLRKMQRQVRAFRFAHRLAKSADQRESLDDVVLEVAEAVAQHWLDVRMHYIAVVMGYLTMAFLFLGFVVTASGRA